MAFILKNDNLEIQIDAPNENYNFSRFDWTGKIASVKFKNIPISGLEKVKSEDENLFGKGFCNEFGIDSALGFDDAKIGDWFHKIGVGLLKKEDNEYLFNKAYKIKPAKFKIDAKEQKIRLSCKSESANGFSYLLKKEIELHENGFTIHYYLKNIGEKDIRSNEYTHNFIALNKASIGDQYLLNFPFKLKEQQFGEIVNPEEKVVVGQNQINFASTIDQEFFFSNLGGEERVKAEWELINLKSKISIKETGNFQTNKVNLWGCKHVISPELFYNIYLKPGKSTTWSRAYSLNNIE
jgi:hypothetical protein